MYPSISVAVEVGWTNSRENVSSLEALELRRVAGAVRSRLFGTTLAPIRIGRFELRHTLGAGGYGRVYAALDPALQRLVALKVVPCSGGVERESALAEARTLAAIRHPNVVTIHEVGEFDDGIYFAMELLDGETLRAWSATLGPNSSELRLNYAMAARGLAAVHASGLAHGDVKPDNFMRTHEGEVVLIDFGLATGATRDSVLGLAGTRGYLAPERLCGSPSSAKADQYSFCLSLYEAAAGTAARFGAGEFAGNLSRTGAVRSRRIRKVLARGLQTDPQLRFPSVAELGRALEWRPWVLAASVAAGLALAGGGSVAWAMNEDPCGTAGESATLDRLESTLADSADRASIEPDLATFLRGHATRISAAKVQRCRATHVDGSQSSALLELRLACLERREQILGAVTNALVTQRFHSSGQAESMMELLRDVASCETRQMDDEPRSTAESRSLRQELSRELGGAEVALVAGHLDEATSKLAQINLRLGQSPEPATRSASTRVEGRVAFARGEVKDGRALLLEAARIAYASGDHSGAFEAWLALAELAPKGGDSPAKAAEWLEFADAARQRLDPGNTLAQARLGLGRGVNATEQGDYDKAVGELETALELWTRTWGPDNPTAASIETNLANALVPLGEVERPTGLYRAALERRTRLLGASHPATANAKFNLGSHLLENLDERREALALIESASSDLERLYGPLAAESADVSLGLAQAYLSMGKLSLAAESAKDAATVMLNHFGSEHYALVSAWMAQGVVAQLQGKGSSASASYAKAHVLGVQQLGAEHPLVLLLEVNRAQLTIESGVNAQALGTTIEGLVRALSQLEQSLGPESEFCGLARSALGAAYLARGQKGAAAEQFRSALKLMPASYRWDRADAYTRLASCLEQGHARSRALRLADELWSELGPDGAARREFVLGPAQDPAQDPVQEF